MKIKELVPNAVFCLDAPYKIQCFDGLDCYTVFDSLTDVKIPLDVLEQEAVYMAIRTEAGINKICIEYNGEE